VGCGCLRVRYPEKELGLPDNGYFGHISGSTQTPLRSIWLATALSILPGLLDLASPIAANAIFALTAMALDLSYIIPIFLCVILPIYVLQLQYFVTQAAPLREPPRSTFPPGTILHGIRTLRLGGKCDLYLMDTVRCRSLRFAHCFACFERQHELRICHHSRGRRSQRVSMLQPMSHPRY
jgi:hypothetical protein